MIHVVNILINTDIKGTLLASDLLLSSYLKLLSPSLYVLFAQSMLHSIHIQALSLVT